MSERPALIVTAEFCRHVGMALDSSYSAYAEVVITRPVW